MATDYKSIFASKTFWGAIIMALSFFFPVFFGDPNTPLGQEHQQSIVANIGIAVGFIVTIVGRFTAKKPVTLTGKPPSLGIITIFVLMLMGAAILVSSHAPTALAQSQKHQVKPTLPERSAGDEPSFTLAEHADVDGLTIRRVRDTRNHDFVVCVSDAAVKSLSCFEEHPRSNLHDNEEDDD